VPAAAPATAAATKKLHGVTRLVAPSNLTAAAVAATPAGLKSSSNRILCSSSSRNLQDQGGSSGMPTFVFIITDGVIKTQELKIGIS
jgi:hypothetical protein